MKYFLIAICSVCIQVSLYAGPVISLDKKSVSMGEYPANESRDAYFTITNSGNTLLHIVKIRKTCGCSKVDIDTKEIAPGGKATLKVVILPESLRGLFSKNIYIQSNDPKQRFLKINVTGEAIPIVTVNPSTRIYVANLVKEAVNHRKVSFELILRDSDVKLGKIEASGLIGASSELLRVSERCFRLSITLIPQATGRFKLRLKIPIVEPASWKPLELAVIGTVVSSKVKTDSPTRP